MSESQSTNGVPPGHARGRAVLAATAPHCVAALRFALPRDVLADVEVLDVNRQRIRLLGGGLLPAGEHTFGWDGLDDEVRTAPDGEYVLRLIADGRVLTCRRVWLGPEPSGRGSGADHSPFSWWGERKRSTQR